MNDHYKRERFVRSHDIAQRFVEKYFERFPVDKYETKMVWRALEPGKIEFIAQRLRLPNL